MDGHGTYRAAGVDYDLLDAGKREAIAAALATSHLAGARGVFARDDSRGEPAFVFDVGTAKLALVMECLGTKSSLAREYHETHGLDRFEWTGYDGVAAIANDVCGVGALPTVINAYFATGSPAWYSVPGRFAALVRGWQSGCEAAGAVWGGGESPMLGSVIREDEIDLAGCAVGLIPEGREPLFGQALQPADDIVLVASSGLHTNGSSLGRAAAEAVGGLGVTIKNGVTVGDALLAPSVIYARLLDAIYKTDIALSYAVPVTGHGLRKLMRADRELTYRIRHLPTVPPIFEFIVETLRLPAAEAYGTLNMGIGFALFARGGQGAAIVALAEEQGYSACVGGSVEDGTRRVVLEPVGVEFEADELQLR